MSNLKNKDICSVTPSENRGIYTYRFRTEVVDRTHSNHPLTSCFVRKVTVVYMGQKAEQYRYQFLCFENTFEGTPLEGSIVLQYNCALLDTLEFSVDLSGKIIHLHNLNLIRLKWEKTKLLLLKEYQGSAVLDYIKNTDHLLQNPEAILAFLNHEKMYGLFFKGWGTDHIRDIERVPLTKANTEKEIIRIPIKALEKEYEGLLYYKNTQLKNVEITEKTNNNIYTNYSVVCLGLVKRNTP